MYLLKLLGFLLLQFCIVFLCLLCQYPVTVADIRSRSIYIQLCHLSPTLPLENSPLYLLYYTKQIKKKKSNHPFYLENYTAIDFDPACPIYFQVLTYLLYRVVYLIDRGFQSAGSPCQGEPAALFLQLSSTAFGCSHWGVPHWCCWMFAGKRVWFRLKSINWGGGGSVISWMARKGLRKVTALWGQNCNPWRTAGESMFGVRFSSVTEQLQASSKA